MLRLIRRALSRIPADRVNDNYLAVVLDSMPHYTAYMVILGLVMLGHI